MSGYSFCESVWAGPKAPWHIRRITDKGLKLGGGIDTTSLCGRVTNGWDIGVTITRDHLTHSCSRCAELYSVATAREGGER